VRKNLLANWTCTFADDFDGTALNPAKWSAVTSASSGLTAGPGCYVDSPQNIAVYDGALHLTARQEAAPFTCPSAKGAFTTQYSSGQVATVGKFFQTYGRFAVRAAFPAATVAGLQSTLWLWPQNPLAAGTVGEIDFAEWYSSYPDRVIPYVHYLYSPSSVNPLLGTNVVTNNGCVIGDASAFHEYVTEWTSSSIVVKIDGQTCLVDRYHAWGPNPFAQPYFVALTQALGIGNNAFVPGTTPLPATTTVDYVRVWK
jgi:beta-glucanase (GH16 family)